MKICRTQEFEHGIKGFKLGWSLIGQPLMSVYCYQFGRVMIDTGQSHMEKEVLCIAKANQVSRIFLTHHHEDHSGNAASIHQSFGAQVFGHKKTGEKLKTSYKILPYQKYIWGKTTPLPVNPYPESIETDLGKMQVIHTPGHSRDHVVYFLPERGVVFSGDLYLGDRIRFFRSDEDIGAQISSLKKLLAFDFDMLLCGHNPRKKNGHSHIRSKLNFLETFYGNIIEHWKNGESAKEIFRSLHLKEDNFTKYFCFGNVSLYNGVKSAILHHQSELA